MRATAQIPRRIVAFSADPWESACPILRIIGPLERCGLSVEKGVEMIAGVPNVSADLIVDADLVVIQRDFPRYADAFEQVMARAHAYRKPIVYDLDDLLLELPFEHPDYLHYRDARLAMLRAVVEADAVTASTQPLCDYLRPYNPRTRLLPNYLNDRLWDLRPQPTPADHAPLCVGYMGGSTHRSDLEMIAPALLRIVERYGERVIFRFFGRSAPPASILEFPNVQWEHLNVLDYAEFASHFSRQTCDVFIAPLGDTAFNRCKSPIKFLEYSALGVPGVYSRVAPYDRVVDGENGLLAATAQEWEECLIRLIEDPVLRRQMGRNAQQTVERDWLLGDHAGQWRSLYRQVLRAYGKAPRRYESLLQVVRNAHSWQNELQQTQEQMTAQLARQDQTIRSLGTQVAQMRNSITWRATEPVRQAYARAQRIQRTRARFWATSAASQRKQAPAEALPHSTQHPVSPWDSESSYTSGDAPTATQTAGIGETIWTFERYSAVRSLSTGEVVDLVICAGQHKGMLERCVGSIRQHTQSGSYRLHLVVHEKDVRSIPPHLKDGADLITHSMEIFNFARANNLGLAHCGGDVVLINDDTEVTPDWLARLKRDSRGIALTGAHTGYQCSGNPDMWGNGESRITRYPINMFCTYIPRRVLETVGPLDEEFFYYGGEDVDYSCRALQHGFPLIVSSAYVHHKGGQSFGGSKARLMTESDKIIYERYGIVAPFELQSIRPLVSVITATRNRARLLPRASRSVLAGLYPDIELIIVDDNSSDSTWQVIEELQARDKRVIAIRMAKQAGSVKARWRGLAVSSGQFIAFMDDDDLAWPNRVSAPLEHLLMHPELDVVYCAFEIVSEAGRERGRTRPFDAKDYLDMKFDIGSGLMLMRRKVIEDVPFMSYYERAVDYDWVFRVIRRGYRIDYCPAVVLDYNRTGSEESHLAGNVDAMQLHEDIRNRERLMNKHRRK
jgi:processive 1,2-diacylglycerol beta-glucosyltransferase